MLRIHLQPMLIGLSSASVKFSRIHFDFQFSIWYLLSYIPPHQSSTTYRFSLPAIAHHSGLSEGVRRFTPRCCVISFNCPTCSRAYETPDETAGKRTKCPNCQAFLTVPDESEEAETLRIPKRLVGRVNVTSREVGVLCKTCFAFFGGKPGSQLACPHCESLCIVPNRHDAKGA